MRQGAIRWGGALVGAAAVATVAGVAILRGDEPTAAPGAGPEPVKDGARQATAEVGAVAQGNAASPPSAAASGSAAAAPGPDGGPGPRLSPPQQLHLLWQDLKQLEQRRPTMSAGEFRAKAVDRTIEYLELDPAGATTFTRTVEDALKDIQEARSRMAWAQTQVPFNPDDPGSVVKHKSSWDRFAHDQEAAIARVIALVGDAPRHRLFRDQTAKWILYVDYHTKER